VAIGNDSRRSFGPDAAEEIVAQRDAIRSALESDLERRADVDQMLANEIVGFDEIKRPTPDDKKARAELLDSLGDERRQQVLDLAEQTRREREPLLHPAPLMRDSSAARHAR
jgi:hypothetical protein